MSNKLSNLSVKIFNGFVNALSGRPVYTLMPTGFVFCALVMISLAIFQGDSIGLREQIGIPLILLFLAILFHKIIPLFHNKTSYWKWGVEDFKNNQGENLVLANAVFYMHDDEALVYSKGWISNLSSKKIKKPEFSLNTFEKINSLIVSTKFTYISIAYLTIILFVNNEILTYVNFWLSWVLVIYLYFFLLNKKIISKTNAYKYSNSKSLEELKPEIFFMINQEMNYSNICFIYGISDKWKITNGDVYKDVGWRFGLDSWQSD